MERNEIRIVRKAGGNDEQLPVPAQASIKIRTQVKQLPFQKGKQPFANDTKVRSKRPSYSNITAVEGAANLRQRSRQSGKANPSTMRWHEAISQQYRDDSKRAAHENGTNNTKTWISSSSTKRKTQREE